jgi:hypothetical protein
MSQLSAAVTAMNSESKFAKAYAKGLKKSEYWRYVLDDSIVTYYFSSFSVYFVTVIEGFDIETSRCRCHDI